MIVDRCVEDVVSGVLNVTFGEVPNLPLTATASDAEPEEAQERGVAVADGGAVAGALDDPLEELPLGFDEVQPTSASGRTATASAARWSGRRVGEGIRPS